MGRFEAATIALQERISERRCEQFGVIEVSKISGQESVVVASVPQEQPFEMKGEWIGDIEFSQDLISRKC